MLILSFSWYLIFILFHEAQTFYSSGSNSSWFEHFSSSINDDDSVIIIMYVLRIIDVSC